MSLSDIIEKIKTLKEPFKTIKVKRMNYVTGEYYFTNLNIKKSLKPSQKEIIEEYFDELTKNINTYFNTNFSDRKLLFIEDIMLSKFKKDMDDTKILISERILKKIIRNSLKKSKLDNN